MPGAPQLGINISCIIIAVAFTGKIHIFFSLFPLSVQTLYRVLTHSPEVTEGG